MEAGDGLLAFVDNGISYRKDVLLAIRQQLRPIADWFDRQRAYVFISSSLLLIYEGSSAAAHNAEPRLVCRMIDFAHVLDAKGERDKGYVQGLAKLQQAVEHALDRAGSAS